MSVYEQASAVFSDLVAGVAQPSEWGALQQRLYGWQRRTYGPLECNECRALALGHGVSEELGLELSSSTDPTSEIDAICDAAIFTIQICTEFGLDAGTLINMPKGTQPSSRVVVGRLSQVLLKGHQRIRGLDRWEQRQLVTAVAVGDVFASLQWLAQDHGDFYTLVLGVAERVMQRTRDLPDLDGVK